MTVESFNLNADTASPKIDVPFHLTVTLRVRERIGEIENLDLPILAELELLGDERQTTGGPHGTLYRETIAVVAHNPGPIAIAPATLQAIDARDGKPKEWYTNGLTLRVTGSISPALNTGGQVVLAVVLRALHLLLWLLLFALGVGCIALIVLLLFVRGRPRLAAAVPEQPAPAESIAERSPRQQAQDALAVLRTQRSRAAAVAVRAAIWRMIGASDGETLADVLHRPEAQEVTLSQAPHRARAQCLHLRIGPRRRTRRRVFGTRALHRVGRMMVARTPSNLRAALAQTIVGQEGVIEGLLLALLCNGHVLLEGPPGLAKTLACRSLAAALDGEFKRIQFTPDLLPSDIVGTRIFDQRESAFATVLGPIFANVVLADEINRAPAKVQSALLEAMQERQVTIGPQSYALPDPFVVMATMNPLDSEGTYALPIAQMDRFLMKVNVGYPSREEELRILDRFAVDDTQPVRGVATLDDVRAWRAQAHDVHVEEKLKRYIVDLVAKTRDPSPYIDYGASPRATLALVFLARGLALIDGRDFALPDDVRAVAPHVLRHRIGFNYRLAAEGRSVESLIDGLIAAVPAP